MRVFAIIFWGIVIGSLMSPMLFVFPLQNGGSHVRDAQCYNCPEYGIYLRGNTALDAFCAGNGTDGLSWASAHVLRDLVLDTSGTGTGIRIADTDRYIVLQNCTISNSKYGINLWNCSRVTVTGCKITNTNVGVMLEHVTTINISGNVVAANHKGVSLWCVNESQVGNNLFLENSIAGICLFQGSVNNSIRSNTFLGCGVIVQVAIQPPVPVVDFSTNVFESNSINGRPLLYYSNTSNLVLDDPPAAGQIILVNCTNITVTDLEIHNTSMGVELVNCQGCTIASSNLSVNAVGLGLVNSSGNVIVNNIADDCFGDGGDYKYIDCETGWGMWILDSDNNRIEFNHCSRCDSGALCLEESRVNNVTHNLMQDCGVRLMVRRWPELPGNNIVDATNMVNGRPLYFYEGVANLSPGNFSNAGQVILVNCTGAHVENITISRVYPGIFLLECSNSVILNGTFLAGSGLLQIFGGRNSIERCLLAGCRIGLEIVASNDNNITENYLIGNERGIRIYGSTRNRVFQNKIHANAIYGIEITVSSNNVIWLNTLVANGFSNAYNWEGRNSRDNGSAGNRWGDYETRYPGATRDGDTWDTPYLINGTSGDYDHHPLAPPLAPSSPDDGLPLWAVVLVGLVGVAICTGIYFSPARRSGRIDANGSGEDYRHRWKGVAGMATRIVIAGWLWCISRLFVPTGLFMGFGVLFSGFVIFNGLVWRKSYAVPARDLSYYIDTWGFDPRKERRFSGTGLKYEKSFPLQNDPGLHAMGVKIVAKVVFSKRGIATRIVFKRGWRRAEIACVHLAIYSGNAGEVIPYGEDRVLDDQGVRMDFPPVQISPEEHFVALRSYVQAIAEEGIMKLLQESTRQSKYDLEALPFGFNAAMHAQVFRALAKLCPDAVRHLALDLLFEIADNTTDKWFGRHIFIFDDLYSFNDLIKHHLNLMKELPSKKWNMIVARCFECSWYRHRTRKTGSKIIFLGLLFFPVMFAFYPGCVQLVHWVMPLMFVVGVFMGFIMYRCLGRYGQRIYDAGGRFIKVFHVVLGFALVFGISLVCIAAGIALGYTGGTRFSWDLFVAFWIYVGFSGAFSLRSTMKDDIFKNKYLVSLITEGKSDTLSYSAFEALVDAKIRETSLEDEGF